MSHFWGRVQRLSSPPLRHPREPQRVGRALWAGRTHQIRVHMASLGTPVVGDAVYGRSRLDRQLDPPPTRQLLHAWRLALKHPVTRAPMVFEAPLPDDFKPYSL